jgi:hypothetical protein
LPEPPASRLSREPQPTIEPRRPVEVEPVLPGPPVEAALPAPPVDASTTAPQVVVPAVWLVALMPTEITVDGAEAIAMLQPGDRARVIATGAGAVLVALPDGTGSGWVQLDPRVQLIAQ